MNIEEALTIVRRSVAEAIVEQEQNGRGDARREAEITETLTDDYILYGAQSELDSLQFVSVLMGIEDKAEALGSSLTLSVGTAQQYPTIGELAAFIAE